MLCVGQWLFTLFRKRVDGIREVTLRRQLSLFVVWLPSRFRHVFAPCFKPGVEGARSSDRVECESPNYIRGARADQLDDSIGWYGTNGIKQIIVSNHYGAENRPRRKNMKILMVLTLPAAKKAA